MPTKDFFSGSGSGRENTGGSRKPQEQDDPFAGMQKLNFDFMDGGADGADDALSFDALFDELPQEPSRSPQPAPGAAAPFVFDERPSGAAEQPKAEPAPRPAQPAAPAQRSTRRAAQPTFDLSALEKEIDRRSQTSRPGEMEGYAPLAFDFDLGDEPPRAAAPVQRPAQPAAPFVMETEQPAAPPASSAAPRSYASQTPVSAASAAAQAPAAATPFVMETEQPAASPALAASPVPTAAAPHPAQPAAPAAAARRPAAPAPAGGLAPGQGSAQRPASRSADYSTISFSLGDVSVEAPTMAFMPIEQINSAASAQAEANRRAAEKDTSTPPPVQSADARAARMAKERNIGAAVFSALMEQDAPPASAARPAASGAASRAPAATMEWPSAPRMPGDTSRAPKPINWRTQTGATGTGAAGTGAAEPQPAARPDPQPETPAAPAPAPQPADAAPDDGLTPLDFNFDDIDSFGSFGAEDEMPSRSPRRGAEFLDLYAPDPDDEVPRRSRSGKGSGSGGGSSPRKPSGSGKGSMPAKNIFAWCGILLVAVLVILLFVVFGDKDDASSSSGSGSGSGSLSTSDAMPGESLPTEPVAAPIPRDEWYMVLANRDSVLPMDYTVEQTETVGDALVDARIAESLRQMVNDAAAAGIRLRPTNGYRTVTRQQELWNARVQKLMTENGLSQADAEVRALDYTSRPGTSDHNTGLGLDIVSEDHPAQDTAYADTAAAAWLLEHAADYGFILRYPSDKTAATGMDFEPYHYRYVGVEQAQLIKASGLCLEEYLAQ